MEKQQVSRFIIFVALAVGILALWNKLFPPPPRVTPAELNHVESQPLSGKTPSQTGTTSATEVPAQETSATTMPAMGLRKVSTSSETITSKLSRYSWTSEKSSGITATELLGYKRTSTGEDILKVGDQPKTFFISFSDSRLASFNVSPFEITKTQEQEIRAIQETREFIVERTFKPIPDTYAFLWNVKVTPKPGTSVPEGLGQLNVHLNYTIPPAHTSSLNMDEAAVFLDGKRVAAPLSEAANPMGCGCSRSHPSSVQQTWTGKVDWVSLGDRYFMQALVPEGKFNPDVHVTAAATTPGSVVETVLSYPIVFQAGNHFLVEGKGYFGPKTIPLLNVIPALRSSIDLGSWLRFIAEPILLFLNFIHDHVISNFGVAIIILTICIRLLLLPLMQKQMKSMKRMQQISPELNKLKEMYANDKQRLNVEMMKVMKEHKVNPLGGCLPLVAQLPVFFSLWRALGSTADLYHAPFFGWITDLSASDPYYVLPIIMAVLMFAQQLVTPASPQMDPAQRKMMMFMPLFFSFFMFKLPSGLCLYMVISTLFGVCQQMVMTRNKSEGSKLQTAPTT